MVVVASQAGNTNWNAAPDVTNIITVTKALQVPINFTPDSPQIYQSTNLLTISGGSGTGAVTYTVVSGPGQIVGTNYVEALAGSGTLDIRVEKAEDAMYFIATGYGAGRVCKS